ncbi:hypothetical protein CDIK_0746 [Cucumispora dikerogammari]|nr:hypothetical protein CDIK_0746 [Cucumispora dikerogammari]
MRKLEDKKIQKLKPISETQHLISSIEFIKQNENSDSINISSIILSKIFRKLRFLRCTDFIHSESENFKKINNTEYFTDYNVDTNNTNKDFILSAEIETHKNFTNCLIFYQNLICLKIVFSSFVDFRYFRNLLIKKLILDSVKRFKYECVGNQINEIEFRGHFNKLDLFTLLNGENQINSLVFNNVNSSGDLVEVFEYLIGLSFNGYNKNISLPVPRSSCLDLEPLSNKLDKGYSFGGNSSDKYYRFSSPADSSAFHLLSYTSEEGGEVELMTTDTIPTIINNKKATIINKLTKFTSIRNKLSKHEVSHFLNSFPYIKYYKFIETNFELIFNYKGQIENIFLCKNFEVSILPKSISFLILEDINISHLLPNIKQLHKLRKIVIKNCEFYFNDFIDSLKNKSIYSLKIENIKLSYNSINKLVQTIKNSLRRFEIRNVLLPGDFREIICSLKECWVIYGDGCEVFVS